KINFTDYFQITFLKKIVIWQDTSGNRIFDCHQTSVAACFVACNLYNIAESRTTYYFNIVSEKSSCGCLMEAAFKALYRYFLFHLYKTKIPAFFAGILLF